MTEDEPPSRLHACTAPYSHRISRRSTPRQAHGAALAAAVDDQHQDCQILGLADGRARLQALDRAELLNLLAVDDERRTELDRVHHLLCGCCVADEETVLGVKSDDLIAMAELALQHLPIVLDIAIGRTALSDLAVVDKTRGVDAQDRAVVVGEVGNALPPRARPCRGTAPG